MDINKKLNWKAKTLILGAVVGAAAGVSAAYLFVRNAEQSGDEPAIAPSDALTIGVSLASLLKMIAGMGSADKS